MPRKGKRPDKIDGVALCSAHCKSSKKPCRSYPVKGRTTCRMHGGTAKRGKDHYNFKTGQHSKDVQECVELLGRFFDRPVEVRVVLRPEPLEEIAAKVGRGQRLDGLVVPSEQMTVGERMRALRAARRLLAQELAELRAEAADGS
jgi:hypothetical protein